MTGVQPAAGPTADATSVTIIGTGFQGSGYSTRLVTVDTTTASPINSCSAATAPCSTNISPTSITLFTPSHAATSTPVDIRVTTRSSDGGTTRASALVAADTYDYVTTPTVSAVSPATGPSTGGNTVTVTGTNLTDSTHSAGFAGESVTFGSGSPITAICASSGPYPAPCLTVVSATQITAQHVPSGSAASVDARVTTPGGTSPISAADQCTYTPGGYTVDGFGGVHPYGGTPPVADAPHFSFNIGRGIVLRPDGLSGYVLDGWGGIHPFGGAPGITGTYGYWSGWDIARGIVLRPDGVSGYVLEGWGGIHPFGRAPAITGTSGYWSGWDIAKGIVLRSDGLSGYVLDGFGGLHPLGGAPGIIGTYAY